MRRISLALAGLLLLPIAAKADTFNYTITGSGGGFSGSGAFTATNNNNGSFTITGISGTGVLGLIAPNDPDFGNDNLLFPTSSRLFDVNGVAFYGSFGRVNLFSTVSGYEVQGFDADNDYFDVPASLRITSSVAATPEPSTMLLSMTGLISGAAAFLRRRTHSASA